MTRVRWLAVAALLALAAGAPAPAAAQTPAMTHAVTLSYWPASTVFSLGGVPDGTWNTGFIALTYSLAFDIWGLRLRYATGAQSNWALGWTGGLSGRDTIWSVDGFYR